MLRITALEEHFVTRALVDAWRSVDERWQDLAQGLSSQGPIAHRLLDIGANRITEMDDAAVAVQVLSLSTPGLAMLDPADAVALQNITNDQLADAIRTRGVSLVHRPSTDHRSAVDTRSRLIVLGDHLGTGRCHGRLHRQLLQRRTSTQLPR